MKELFLALIIITIILGIIYGPMLFIWALNTLFPALGIPYNLKTWAAALFIQIMLASQVSWKKE